MTRRLFFTLISALGLACAPPPEPEGEPVTPDPEQAPVEPEPGESTPGASLQKQYFPIKEISWEDGGLRVTIARMGDGVLR